MKESEVQHTLQTLEKTYKISGGKTCYLGANWPIIRADNMWRNNVRLCKLNSHAWYDFRGDDSYFGTFRPETGTLQCNVQMAFLMMLMNT
jgi:hypothetical protein